MNLKKTKVISSPMKTKEVIKPQITTIKGMREKVDEVFQTQYDETFPQILNLNQSQFLTKIINNSTSFLKEVYNEKEINSIYAKDSLLKAEKNIKNKYIEAYKIISEAWNEYLTNPSLFETLTQFRKHCKFTDPRAFHKCPSLNSTSATSSTTSSKTNILNTLTVSNLITIKSNPHDEEPSYVICINCKYAFNSGFINLYCENCKSEYYSSTIGKNEDVNILPATWDKYHCGNIINEIMKCVECKSKLYINLQTDRLVCLNKECGFTANPQSIIWKCNVCRKDFTSNAKIYNPLEMIVIKKSINKALLLKIIAYPKYVPCCKIKPELLKFTHKKDCKGLLYQGNYNKCAIVVCSLCHAMNFFERFVWTCPRCDTRFRSIDRGKELRSSIGLPPRNSWQRYCSSAADNKMKLSNHPHNQSQNINNISNSKEVSLSKNIDDQKAINIDKESTSAELNGQGTESNGSNPGTLNKSKNKKCRYHMLHSILEERNNNKIGINDTVKRPFSRAEKDVTKKNLLELKNLEINDQANNGDVVKFNLNVDTRSNSNNKNIVYSDTKCNKNKKVYVPPKVKNYQRIESKRAVINLYDDKDDKINLNDEDNRSSLNAGIIEKYQTELQVKDKRRGNFNSSLINLNNKIDIRVHSPENKFKKQCLNDNSMKDFNIKDNINNDLEGKNNLNYSQFLVPVFSTDLNLNIKPDNKKEKENDEEIIEDIDEFTEKGNMKNDKIYDEKTANNADDEIDDEDLKDPLFKSTNLMMESSNNFLEEINKSSIIPLFNMDDYVITRPIGEGSFGKIYIVQNVINKKLQFALKKIIAHDNKEVKKYQKEFELVYSHPHNNIMKIYNVEYKCLDFSTISLYVLMELAKNDWNFEIKKRNEKKDYYKERELIQIIKQLVSALAFLQKNKIAHRDIKPQNILIYPGFNYKVADFGEAKESKVSINQNTLKGTELYMSPALYHGLKWNKKNITHNIFKSDVFSLGLCVLYAATLNIRLLLEIRELDKTLNMFRVINKYLGDRYSKHFLTILRKMLEYEEAKRADFVELDNLIK